MEGKIPQPPAAKEGRFHLRGPQVGRKASKALEKGIQSLGPLDFGNRPDDKAANRADPPPTATPGEGNSPQEKGSWDGAGALPELPGDWCSIRDEVIGEKTLTTLTNFTRGDEGAGGFEDQGEIWIGILEAFDIARVEFQRIATYTPDEECLEWTQSELEFTLSFQELLNHDSEEVRAQMRSFEKHFSKLWKLEWLNEDPCQPMKHLGKDRILVKNRHTALETISFRCSEDEANSKQ